jgi:hypothetical protein
MGEVITDIRCACHDHIISLESWHDDLYVTLWQPIQSKDWGRFHWAWQSLRGRWRGGNDVVLDRETVVKLCDALTDHLEGLR